MAPRKKHHGRSVCGRSKLLSSWQGDADEGAVPHRKGWGTRQTPRPHLHDPLRYTLKCALSIPGADPKAGHVDLHPSCHILLPKVLISWVLECNLSVKFIVKFLHWLGYPAKFENKGSYALLLKVWSEKLEFCSEIQSARQNQTYRFIVSNLIKYLDDSYMY